VVPLTVLTVPKVLTVLVLKVPEVLTVLVLTVLVRGASAQFHERASCARLAAAPLAPSALLASRGIEASARTSVGGQYVDINTERVNQLQGRVAADVCVAFCLRIVNVKEGPQTSGISNARTSST